MSRGGERPRDTGRSGGDGGPRVPARAATSWHAASSAGTNRSGCRRADGVPAVDGAPLAPAHPIGHRHLARRRHDVVVVGDDDGRRHVDPRRRRPRVEAQQWLAGLDDVAPVVAGDLVVAPPRPTPALDRHWSHAPEAASASLVSGRASARTDVPVGDADSTPLAHAAG